MQGFFHQQYHFRSSVKSRQKLRWKLKMERRKRRWFFSKASSSSRSSRLLVGREKIWLFDKKQVNISQSKEWTFWSCCSCRRLQSWLGTMTQPLCQRKLVQWSGSPWRGGSTKMLEAIEGKKQTPWSSQTHSCFCYFFSWEARVVFDCSNFGI